MGKKGRHTQDWEKFNRAKKSANGVALNPFYIRAAVLPSQKQLDFIQHLIDTLASHDIDVTWYEPISSGAYLRDKNEAYKLTQRLLRERQRNGIPSDTELIFVNLCKDKKTGKKIKYKTRTRYAVPVGYEFIGELSKDVVILEVG